MSLVIYFLAWYIIGFLSFILFLYFEDGEITLYWFLFSFLVGFTGLLIPFLILIRLLLDKWPNLFEDRVLISRRK